MGEKNLLLISMSLLHVNKDGNYDPLVENFYESMDGSFSFSGVSQLEPGTKFFLRKLQQEGRKLDKIFIVESPETTSPKKLEKKNNEENAESFLNPKETKKFIKTDIDSEGMTSVDYYKERIYQYVNGKEYTYRGRGGIKAELADETAKIDDDIKQGSLKLPDIEEDFFVDVRYETNNEISDNPIFNCVSRICEKIREIAYNSHDRVHLFVDMQGSRRDFTFILNTAIKMLEISGISVEMSVAIEYLPSNNSEKKPNIIVDTTSNDRILKMVSGMNEFVTTGRGDTLNEFLEDTRDLSDFNLDKEEEIIHSIREISDAISICDMDAFGKGLKAFKKAEENYQKEVNQNPLFKVFVDDLKKDYDRFDLLNSSSPKVLNQIGWCLRKKLYQQALTLIESKVPDSIVDDRILYYGNEEDFRCLMAILEDKGLKAPPYMIENERIKDNFKKYLWIRYVVFEKDPPKKSDPFISMNIKDSRGNVLFEVPRSKEIPDEKRYVWGKQSIRIKEFLSFYDEMRQLRNKINHATGETEEKLNDIWEKFCTNEKKCLTMADNLHVVIGKFIKRYKELENIDMDLSLQFPLARLKQYVEVQECLKNNNFPDAFVDDKILYYGDNNQLNLLIERLQKNGCLNNLKNVYSDQKDNCGNKTVKKGQEKGAWITQIVVFDEKLGSFVLNGYHKACEKYNIEDETYKKRCLEINELLERYLYLVNNKFSNKNVSINLPDDVIGQYNEFMAMFNEMKENGIGIDLSKYFPLKN